jgi:hypothetical protein
MSESKENIFQFSSLIIKNRITLSVLFLILVEIVLFLSFDVNPLSKPLILPYLLFFVLLLFWDKYRNENQNRSTIWSNLNSIFILNTVYVMFSLYLRSLQ